jgi:diaminopimelate decarboxylase
MMPEFPDVCGVSLGGGIPHNYNPSDPPLNLSPLKDLLERSHARLCEAAGRDLRLEIEPGRFFVAGSGSLITRVHDVKETRDNPKGQGVTFAMVDAGFVDLVRPVMYGSYHDIEVYTARDAGSVQQANRLAVAGPMCESGDVFTQQSGEMIAPRQMPLPEAGDIMAIRDGGAYGYSMSSNYNSLGRPPQIMLSEDGSLESFTRRETLEDLLRPECGETLEV